jgi:YVTN family beta-propeller protein
VNPKIVTMSPSGDRIYVSNWSSDDITVLDSLSLAELGKIKVGKNPRGSDTDLGGGKLFVANFNGYSLSVVDTKAMKQIKFLEMKRMPRHVKTTPDGKHVLISNMGTGADAVAVVDATDLEVINWIAVGTGPKSLCITPDSRIAFSADFYSHTVSIIDIENAEVFGVIPGLGKSPCGIDLSSDGKILYITSWYSNDLWAFDLEYTFPEEN